MDDSFPNPLRPLSIPFALRAILGIGLALYLIFGDAARISALEGASMLPFSAGLSLLTVSLYDALRAFRTWVSLSERSIAMGIIFCDCDDVNHLMLSGISPNERYLSWIGKWAVRVSGSFAALPVLYQRLAEVAITALAFGVAGVAIFVLFFMFGHYSGKPELTAIIAGWLWNSCLGAAYLFWIAMAGNFWTASRWGRKLKVSRIVNLFGSAVLTLATVSVLVQRYAAHVAHAPSFKAESIILVIGSVFIVVSILLLWRFRSAGSSWKVDCSRIQVTDNASVQPQTVIDAFGSVLAETKGGSYRRICQGRADLEEQANTPAGTFEGCFGGEYDAHITRVGSVGAVRTLGSVVGVIGVALGAASYVLFYLTIRHISVQFWSMSACLLLFGEIALIVAYYPLSEVLCTSYLIGFQASGSYQRRGDGGVGRIVSNYRLDGGLARVTSLCFVPSAMAIFEARRSLATVTPDEKERSAVLSAFRSHIANASSDR